MTTPKHTYETIEGTEPTTYGEHEPRTVIHTVTTGAEVDVSMMTEMGDGVFVNWSECRKCNLRVGHCKCPSGPTEPHYMKAWRDKRFKRDLSTRPEPEYKLLPSVIEWVQDLGYEVTKKVEKREEVAISVADNPHVDPDRESATEEYRDLLTGVAADNARQSAFYEANDRTKDAGPDGDESTDEKCRTCGTMYSPFGDGWDGECPDCADKTYAAEFGSEMDDEPMDAPRPIEDVHLPDSEQKVPDHGAPIFEQVTGEKPHSLDDAVAPEKVDAGLDAALERVRAARSTDGIDAGF